MDILSALNVAPEPPSRPSDAPTGQHDAPASPSKSAFGREFDNAAPTTADDGKSPAASKSRAAGDKNTELQDTENAQKGVSNADNRPTHREFDRDALGVMFKEPIAVIVEAKQAKEAVDPAGKVVAPARYPAVSADTAEVEAAPPPTNKKPTTTEGRLAFAHLARFPIENGELRLTKESKAVLTQQAKAGALALKIEPNAVEDDQKNDAAGIKRPAKHAAQASTTISAVDAALLVSPGMILTPKSAADGETATRVEGVRLLD
ncbi:MAG TPA: hypothetical protein VNH64_02805, partial [Parvularculaceae bacterium]|nr:hypothetical protein [Parvularculaceae bacterium]